MKDDGHIPFISLISRDNWAILASYETIFSFCKRSCSWSVSSIDSHSIRRSIAWWYSCRRSNNSTRWNLPVVPTVEVMMIDWLIDVILIDYCCLVYDLWALRKIEKQLQFFYWGVDVGWMICLHYTPRSQGSSLSIVECNIDRDEWHRFRHFTKDVVANRSLTPSTLKSIGLPKVPRAAWRVADVTSVEKDWH